MNRKINKLIKNEQKQIDKNMNRKIDKLIKKNRKIDNADRQIVREVREITRKPGDRSRSVQIYMCVHVNVQRERESL